MKIKLSIWSRLGSLRKRRAVKQEIDEELRFHVEQRTVENIAKGMSPDEAWREARKRFGNLQSVREECRDVRGASFGEMVIKDFRFGFRMLCKSPGFTVAAVLPLAVGIGAVAAIFSLVNGILLSSLPVPNPQELRVIEWSGAEVHNTRNMGITSDDGPGRRKQDAFSGPAFLALRKQCVGLANIFAYVPLYGGVTARARHEAVSAEGMMVSDNFFAGLGVAPLIGRLLGEEDERPESAPAVVISYKWWERQFGLDPGVLGQAVTINGHSFSVIGVLPRGFAGVRSGVKTEIYASLSAQPQLLPDMTLNAPDAWWVPVMARLKSGVSDAKFQAALNVAFVPEAEGVMQLPRIVLTGGRAGPDEDRSHYRKQLMQLMCVVGMVLLVVCANLAGLSLARGAARQHEFAVRAALGAGRWRLIRQSLAESMLIALLGGGLGVVVAIWGKTAISQLLAGSSDGLPYNTDLDLKALGFTLAVALVAALLSGLLPALRAAGVDPKSGLKERGTFAAPRLRGGRLLVATQVAFSLLLLAGAGLYLRTLVNLGQIRAGFATENLLLFQVKPGNAGYREPQLSAFYDRIQQSLAAIPGVRAAALTQYALLSSWMSSGSFKIPGRPSEGEIEGEIQQNGTIEHSAAQKHPFESGPKQQAYQLIVGETFFATMGIPVLQGRELSATDTGDAPKVVVVNQTFVRKYFPGETPIGQTLNAHGANWQIVGVSADAKYADIEQEMLPTMYFSFRQHSTGEAYFALRTASSPLAATEAARKVVAAADPNIPLTEIRTQEQVRDRTISQERMFAILCGSLAMLAVLLCCIGLYGLMAYHVARRTGEIGLRMALGATGRQIARPILYDSLLLAGGGMTVGLPLTVALTRLIRGNLYGVEPSDPVSLGGAVVLLLVVTLMAAWLPARRAARVDPLVALRHE